MLSQDVFPEDIEVMVAMKDMEDMMVMEESMVDIEVLEDIMDMERGLLMLKLSQYIFPEDMEVMEDMEDEVVMEEVMEDISLQNVKCQQFKSITCKSFNYNSILLHIA